MTEDEEKEAEAMREQIADYKAALDLQAKWFSEWQANKRRPPNG